jgi:Flp pilus assembly protein TadG
MVTLATPKNRLSAGRERIPKPLLPLGTIRRLRQDESGAVAIETAASFMLVITLVFGIIEFSMMIYTYGVMAEAARHGVRYASIHGADSSTCSGPSTGCSDPTAANVVNDVNTFAAKFIKTMSGAVVQVSYPDAGGSTVPSRVTVAITYTYQPLFRFPGLNRTFQLSAQGRIMY